VSTHKILIIDDEPAILETLSMLLGLDSNFKVDTLNDVARWREKVLAIQPDIILVDFKMPAMNGDEFIKALSASGLRKSVKAVCLFSATPFSPAQVQKMGADAFFEKPFEIETILSQLYQLLAPPRTYLEA
jgi:DNA-binding response OmpR family regulator